MEARPSSKSAADRILMTLTTVQVRTIWSMAICIVAKALPSIQKEAFIKKSSQFGSTDFWHLKNFVEDFKALAG